MNHRNLLAFIGALILTITTTQVFALRHPGCLNNKAQLDFIKSKVKAGTSPWSSGYSKMKGSATLNYTPKPHRAWSNPAGIWTTETYDLMNDGQAAYACALEWYINGDQRYADKAIQILNAWNIWEYIGGVNGVLATGCMWSSMVWAAEIIKHSGAGWAAADQQKFSSMLSVRVWDRIKTGSQANCNWEAWIISTLTSVAVFLDSEEKFNFCMDMYFIRLNKCVYESGKAQETCRDLKHTQMGLAPLTATAEIAWNQGVDVYNLYFDNRLKKGCEYNAPLLLGSSSAPNPGCEIDTKGGYMWPFWAMAQHHYKHRRGQSTPWTDKMVSKMRPEKYVLIGWGTLTHTSLPNPVDNTAPSVPSGFKAIAVTSTTARLTWSSSSDAQSGVDYYIIYRNGVKIDSLKSYYVGSHSLVYDDAGVTGNYKYEICAVNVYGKKSAKAAATLGNWVDDQAPVILSATAISNNTIRIVFNEAVNGSDAGSKAKYSLSDGAAVNSAVLAADKVTVELSTATLTEGKEYTLSIGTIRDLADTPNTMAAQTKKVMYIDAIRDDFDTQRLTWAPKTASRWDVAADGSDKSLHLNTTSYSNDGQKPGEYSLVSGVSVGDFDLSVDIKSPEGTNAYADAGVIFGYTDENNFYYFLANADATSNQLFKVVNGNRSQLISVGEALITDTNYHTCRITSVNGKVTVYWDGAVKGSADVSVPTGKVGVCSYNDEAWFDDFALVALDGSGGSPVRDYREAGQDLFRVAGNRIAIHTSGQHNVTLYNAAGKRVSGFAVSGSGSWDLLGGHLPGGVYLVKVSSGGREFVTKVMKF